MGERMKAEDYIKESQTSEKSNYFYSLIKRVLLTITMVLIVLISCNLNKEFKDTIKKYVYERSIFGGGTAKFILTKRERSL